MNVTVENLAPCKKLVRVEVEAQQVDETFVSVAKDYQRRANLPGFRPGKAPQALVLRNYEKEIQDDVKRKLISDSYKKALEDKDIDVIGYPDVEEIQFGRGQPLLFAATVETAPDFELPDYKGLPARAEARSVTEADVDHALMVLCESKVSYATVDRPVATGDVAVVNYSGTCDGKPITDIAPTAKGLTEQKNFWIEVGASSFIPGFAEQLLGAKATEKRTVSVDYPADFVTTQLAGKHGVYEVEVVEVKQKTIPALNDALAKNYGAADLAQLRQGVQRDLENELKYKRDKTIRTQLMRGLLDKITFELPETAVAQETRNVVYDLVQQNQKRGVPRQVIEEQKEKIYTAATLGAKERVKAAFLMRKIAEKENIKVAESEIVTRITHLAAMYQIPVEKFADDLKKRNGLIEIYDQLMNEKVVDFLQANAQIEEVPPGTLPEPQAEAQA